MFLLYVYVQSKLIFCASSEALFLSCSPKLPCLPSCSLLHIATDLCAFPVSIPPNHTTLYDHLSAHTLSTLNRLVLFSLAHKTAPGMRCKTVDTNTNLTAQGMACGHAWHALQAQVFAMAHAGLEGHPGVGTGKCQQQQTVPTVLQ